MRRPTCRRHVHACEGLRFELRCKRPGQWMSSCIAAHAYLTRCRETPAAELRIVTVSWVAYRHDALQAARFRMARIGLEDAKVFEVSGSWLSSWSGGSYRREDGGRREGISKAVDEILLTFKVCAQHAKT